MLSQAIGALLPSAVGVALSPIPIIAVILMLSTERARSNGIAFSIGWIAGLTVVSIVVVTLVGGTDPASTADDGVNWLKVGLGVLFLAMARRQWRSRPKAGEQAEMPGWMQTVDHFTAPKSLGLGVVLSALNPKNLALTLAAAASVGQAGLSAGDDAIAIAVFVVLSSITVVGCVVVYVVAPRAAEKPLAAMNEFMSAHNAVIMMIVLLLLGAKLIGDGFGGLG